MWNFPLFPDQASTMAKQVDALYFFELGIAGFFTALHLRVDLDLRGRAIARKRSSIARILRLTSKVMEVSGSACRSFWAWSCSPGGRLSILRIYDPPADALEVAVVAKQWMWHLQHAEGRAEINELHVPLGRPVKLTMTSQDVIHSFFVRRFG